MRRVCGGGGLRTSCLDISLQLACTRVSACEGFLKWNISECKLKNLRHQIFIKFDFVRFNFR